MDPRKKETIIVVGYGWVGQANALALSHAGYHVSYFDTGEPKFHYSDKYGDRYANIKPLSRILEKDSSDTWYIVCVGDRVSEEGEQDISAIKKALESLEGAKGTVILRSTILPGSLSSLKFHYYVPEFLHEKKAVEECMMPQYFIVGKNTADARWPSFFDVWQRNSTKSFQGTPEEASYLKYLSNIWNALRIAFVNEFGDAITTPTDKEKLAHIERLTDFFFERKEYLRYGRSYGGHCLPKDTHAFFAWYKKHGKELPVIEGVHRSNLAHQKIEKEYPHLPEWFSVWVRPQVSGWAALHALKFAIRRKVKRSFNKIFRKGE